MDLQRLVHEDMKRHFSAYPRNWGLSGPDRNIDHRRVPNLRTYFQRAGYALPVTSNPDDYQAGDLVACVVPPNLPHIMVVSDRVNASGRPLIIHNIGAGAREEDRLFEFEITGHFRVGFTPENEERETKRDSTPGPTSLKKKTTSESARRYLVGARNDGGTLSGIASLFYGDATHWKKIYDANRDVIQNPDLIRNGMVLRIP